MRADVIIRIKIFTVLSNGCNNDGQLGCKKLLRTLHSHQ